MFRQWSAWYRRESTWAERRKDGRTERRSRAAAQRRRRTESPRGFSTGTSGPHRLLEPLGVLRAELRHLRRDHRPAIALVRVPPEVVLVIRLGGIEDAGGHDFGDDRIVEHPVGGELRDQPLGLVALLSRVREDRRAVLAAAVRSLAVEGARIVKGEEQLEQLPVGQHRRVEGDLDRLRGPGP